MSTEEIRQKLHEFIEAIEDKKAEAIYTLLEDQIDIVQDFELSDEQFEILEKEREKHLNGTSKSYTWEEAQKIIRGR
jgi:hypothetical protein